MKTLTTSRAATAAGIVGLAVFLICWLIWWLTRPPQMGGDEEVVKAVDALFTAITARDEKLLGQCEQRLHAYKEAGRLATKASDYVEGIIQKARGGRWQSAAQTLYDFMKAQQREGTHSHPRMGKDRPSSGKKQLSSKRGRDECCQTGRTAADSDDLQPAISRR